MGNSAHARLANHEIVTLAVFKLGGDKKPVHLEDIAVTANALAPKRRFVLRGG